MDQISHLEPDFDVIVIGAGINGVAIARDAALRGLRALLVEQNDVCSGVSAWSGRLVHGGLRYLEQYDVALVRESLKERERLFQLAPHLVKPVPLLIPVYKHNRRSSWLVRLGMTLYDTLSLNKTPPHHRMLSAAQTRQRFTGIGTAGLAGAALFYDGQVEYAERLCIELAVDAHSAGAVIRTHSQVDELVLESGRAVGVRFMDRLTSVRVEARAPLIFNVTGPWIDRLMGSAQGSPPQPRLNGGTKGSHLIVDPFPGAPSDVVYYESRRDGRLVLIIPWMGRYLIGTTDIRFDADPDDARCDIDEAEYLLHEVNALIPEANLELEDVLFTYSGVRPLPYVPDKAESSVPRSHILYDHAKSGMPGVVTVVGGKLTTHRQLAEDAVDDALKRLGRKRIRCSTARLPLPGARVANLEAYAAALARSSEVPASSVHRLVRLYGSRASAVLDLVITDPALGTVVDPDTGLLSAELVFAVEVDLARTLTDVMARRVLLAFEPGHGRAALGAIVEVLASHLAWDADRRAREVAEYEAWLGHLAVPDPSGSRSDSSGAVTKPAG